MKPRKKTRQPAPEEQTVILLEVWECADCGDHMLPGIVDDQKVCTKCLSRNLKALPEFCT